jgi:Virulence factor
VAEYRVTYWRDLPSLVTARDGRHTAKAALDARFMVAIDEAAMRLGATDSDAYLEGWRQSEWEQRDGSPDAVVAAVAQELETQYDPERVQEMLDSYGT